MIKKIPLSRNLHEPLSDAISRLSSDTRNYLTVGRPCLDRLLLEHHALQKSTMTLLDEYRVRWIAEQSAPTVDPRSLHQLIIKQRHLHRLIQWLCVIQMALFRCRQRANEAYSDFVSFLPGWNRARCRREQVDLPELELADKKIAELFDCPIEEVKFTLKEQSVNSLTGI